MFVQFLIYSAEIGWELILGQALCWLVFVLIVDFTFTCSYYWGGNFPGECFSVQQRPGSVREFNAASTMQGSSGAKGFKATDLNHTLGFLFK